MTSTRCAHLVTCCLLLTSYFTPSTSAGSSYHTNSQSLEGRLEKPSDGDWAVNNVENSPQPLLEGSDLFGTSLDPKVRAAAWPKRGKWATNNVQMWGKRSLDDDDYDDAFPIQPSSERWLLPRSALKSNTKRKSWTKNNFQMWGKRSDDSSRIDEEARSSEDAGLAKRARLDDIIRRWHTQSYPKRRTRLSQRRAQNWGKKGWASNNMRIWG